MCICDPVKWYACGEENTNNANSSLTLSIQLPSSVENNLENMAGRQIISPAASGVAGEKTVLQELLEAMTVIYQTQPSSLLELCINTNRPAYRKSLHLQSSFFSPHVTTHVPHVCATLTVNSELPGGQLKRSVQADCWEDAPLLSPPREDYNNTADVALSLPNAGRQGLLWQKHHMYFIYFLPQHQSSAGCCSLTLRFYPSHTALSPEVWGIVFLPSTLSGGPAEKPVTTLARNEGIR